MRLKADGMTETALRRVDVTLEMLCLYGAAGPDLRSPQQPMVRSCDAAGVEIWRLPKGASEVGCSKQATEL